MNEGFAPGIGEKLRSYVYLLVDPRTGRAFYAGRGRNDRCFRHVQAAGTAVEALEGAPPGSEGGRRLRAGGGEDDERVPDGGPAGRGYPVLGRIREIESGGRSVRIDILRYGLTGDEARLVEAVARDALGLGPAPGGGAAARRALPGQRTEASTLNTRLARPVKIKRGHRVVLLRPGRSIGPGFSEAQLDAATGSGWKVGRRWTDPRSPRSPQWAFVVVDDLVRAVFRIDGWKPAESTPPSQSPRLPGRSARWTLTGERDPEMERKYRGRNVSAYLSPGSQNPVTYVWCGPHWVNRPI